MPGTTASVPKSAFLGQVEIRVAGWQVQRHNADTPMKPRLSSLLALVVLLGAIPTSIRGADKDVKIGVDEPVHRSTRTAIAGGTWTWVSTDPSDQNTIQFGADGTGSHGARGNIKWEATANREITITHPTKGQAVVRLNADTQSFRGTGYNGKPVTGKRMK